MSLLDDKIEEIYIKVSKLIEQNAQYKRVVHDLTNQNKKLKSTNAELLQQLKEQQASLSDSPFDKESLQAQIDQYIQDIDLSIQWLSDFES